MTDEEIYQDAANVIGSLVSDFSLGIYAKLGGSLSIGWSQEPRVTAWAESSTNPSEPPRHQVVISYELVRRFYRDAQTFHAFCDANHVDGYLSDFFSDFDPKPRLSPALSRGNSVRNMYLGAITWVFFHELGHLTQEHGHIRATFANGSQIAQLEDCELSQQQPLDANGALISQVTELAADHEATNWCIMELIKHFLLPEGGAGSIDPQGFKDTLFLFVCGLSCAFYRFYGERPSAPEAIPASSHPTPIRRLEACLPIVYETFHLIESQHGLSRRQLVHLCAGAAYMAGFFWNSLYSNDDRIPDNFLIKGLLQDPYRESYWTAIIASWAKIESEVRRVRRFGTEFGLLSFTDEFRDRITSS